MPYKPNEFFPGVIDLFVLVLPGAMLMALAWIAWEPVSPWPQDEPNTLVLGALALGAFVCGHFVSGLGAWMEDVFLGKCVGKGRREREKQDYAELRGQVGSILGRMFSGKSFEKKNLRRWASLLVFHAGGYGSTNLVRKDADRRFFRNTTVVFSLALVLKLLCLSFGRGSGRSGEDLFLAASLFGLAAISLVRFLYQDKRYSRDAYEALIVMDKLGQLGAVSTGEWPRSPEKER